MEALQEETNSILDRLIGWAGRHMHTRAGYALVFLILFSLTWVPIICCNLFWGKSFIWAVDGLSQQYVWFVYAGQWISQAAHTIFIDHSLNLPMWTMDSGYGTDVVEVYLSTLANPFMWVSALVPARFAEFALELVSLLQIYLAGLAFSAWVRGHGASRANAMVGALYYVFASNVAIIFSQPSFLFVLLVAPLVLIGTDRIFARRGAGLFVVSLSWLLLSSFYDAYMLLVLLLIYCVVQFFVRVDAGRPAAGKVLRLLGWAGLFLGLIALCILVSSVLVMPQALSLLGDDRMGVRRYDAPLYGLGYYASVLEGMTSHFHMPADAIFGVGPLAMLSVTMLILRRREGSGRRALLLVAILLFVMLLLPFAGRLMNGMQYPANRWIWGFDLCLSFMVAKVVPDLTSATHKERRVLIGMVIVFGAVTLLLPLPGRGTSSMVGYAMLLAMLALVCCARLWDRRRFMAALAALVMVCSVTNFITYLSPYFDGRVVAQMGVAKSYAFHYTLGPDGLIDQASDYDDTYRYDRSTYVASGVYNSGLITSHMAPNYYNSFYNQRIDTFNQSLGLVDSEGVNFRYGALNGRSQLEALLGVKYFYLPSGSNLLPASFVLANDQVAQGVGADGTDRALYRTDVVAPLAFVSDTVMSLQDYYALDTVDRSHALLKAVVVDDPGDVSGVQHLDAQSIPLISQDLDYSVKAGSGVHMEGDSFVVTATPATVTLTFDAPGDAETYLCVHDLTYKDSLYQQRYDQNSWAALGRIGRMKVRLAQPFQELDSNGSIDVFTQAGDRAGTIHQMNAKDHMYGGKHDWALNLGFSADGMQTLTLRFNNMGTYAFSNVHIRSLPMQSLASDVAQLKNAGAQDITLSTNRIGCTAHADQDGSLLFFSVAYSDGWSAQVDGAPARIINADLGFMAVELPAGDHQVELTYATPHLGLFAAMSVAGVVLSVLACLLLRRTWRAIPAHYE